MVDILGARFGFDRDTLIPLLLGAILMFGLIQFNVFGSSANDKPLVTSYGEYSYQKDFGKNAYLFANELEMCSGNDVRQIKSIELWGARGDTVATINYACLPIWN